MSRESRTTERGLPRCKLSDMTANDRSILKNLAVSREFEVLKRLADDMIVNWTQQIATGQTEFEYLRGSFERDRKIMGLRALLTDVERMI